MAGIALELVGGAVFAGEQTQEIGKSRVGTGKADDQPRRFVTGWREKLPVFDRLASQCAALVGEIVIGGPLRGDRRLGGHALTDVRERSLPRRAVHVHGRSR